MFKKTLYGSMLMFSEGHNFKLCATPDNLGITSLGLNQIGRASCRERV